MQADKSLQVASADLNILEMEEIDCLSGKVWEAEFLKITDCNILPIEEDEPKLEFQKDRLPCRPRSEDLS